MDSAVCSQCGAAFACGRDEPTGCWCARLPPLDAARIEAARGCLCERCLAARLAEAIRERPLHR